MEDEVLKQLGDLYQLKEEFDREVAVAIESGNTERAQQLALKFTRSEAELRDRISPFELGLRRKIAKEHGYKFVDQFGPNGLARAELETGGWQFVDREGVTDNLLFNFANQFSGNLALVQSRINPLSPIDYFFVDEKGHRVSHLFVEAKSFSQGYAAVLPSNSAWHYINEDGKSRLGEYLEANSFSEGLAWVSEKVISGNIKEYKLIDTHGNASSKIILIQTTPFSEGLSAVKLEEGWYYLNRNLDNIFETAFHFASPFSEDLAVVRFAGDDNFSFIDRRGVVLTGFGAAGSFSEGLAPVLIGSHWYFIQKSGDKAIEEGFHMAESFSGGVAMVEKYGDSYYIDHYGRRVFG